MLIEKVVWGTPGKLSTAAEQQVQCGVICSLGGWDIRNHKDLERILSTAVDGDNLMLIISPDDEEEEESQQPSVDNLNSELLSQFDKIKHLSTQHHWYQQQHHNEEDSMRMSRLADVSFNLVTEKMCMQGRRGVTLLT